MQNSDETLQRQIQYIYNQLEAQPEAEQAEYEFEDDDGDDEDEEDYGDENDENEDDIILGDEMAEAGLPDILKIEGVLTGEEWLTSQFLLANEEAMTQTIVISKKIEQDNKDKLNRSDISKRPISPFGTGPG